MTKEKIWQQLTQVGAILTESHIVYTSGRHGSAYVNKDAIYPHTQLTEKLCRTMAENFGPSNIDVVIAPAVGAIILSQWVAHHLSQLMRREVLGVYAEKEGESFEIKRGYDQFISGKRVLVVEDVLTTGGSVKKVVEATRRCGGNVIGVAALCNRGEVTEAHVGDVPLLFSLVQIRLDSWDALNCPLCAKKVPINTQVGKGKEFLKTRKG